MRNIKVVLEVEWKVGCRGRDKMLEQLRSLLELTRKSNEELSCEMGIIAEDVMGNRPLAGRGSRCLPVLQLRLSLRGDRCLHSFCKMIFTAPR